MRSLVGALGLSILCSLVSVKPIDPFPIRGGGGGPMCGEEKCQCSEEQSSCYCSGMNVIEVPPNLWRNVTKLTLRCVGIEKIRSSDFEIYSGLTQVEIIQAPSLEVIEADAFKPLIRLKKLSIRDCPKLERIEGYLMERTNELLTLEIRRTAISRIPKLKMVLNSLSPPVIDLSENEIKSIETGEVDNILVAGLRLSHNRITRIAPFAFKNSRIFVLSMDNNPISQISHKAFSGIADLNKLDLSHTDLRSLPEEGLEHVEVLIIENTPNLKQLPPLVAFVNLKEVRLHYPYHCCLFKYAPASPKNLEQYAKNYEGNLQELREKHCVDENSTTTSTEDPPTSSPTVPPPTTTHKGAKMRYMDGSKRDSADIELRRRSRANCTDGGGICTESSESLDSDDQPPDRIDFSRIMRMKRSKSDIPQTGQFGAFEEEEYDEDEEQEEAIVLVSSREKSGGGGDRGSKNEAGGFLWGEWHTDDEENAQSEVVVRLPPVPLLVDLGIWETAAVSVPKVNVPCVDGDRAINAYYANITCTPQPDALNPCEDVMIGWHLRIFLFFVWMAAIVGNVLVIVVLFVTTQPRQRVTNFLMLNLAFADLCTGVYLAMLAMIDITTKGEYYNYAVAWQTGWGCKIAGTLTVFASELSIVTMVMISFEVWYNTKYAIFQYRLPLSVVFPVMAAGWLLAIALAVLPLIGINDYSPTSTCLPLRLHSLRDRAYLMSCLGLNVLGFAYIVFNYLSVYRMVAKSTAATTHSQDMALAKLMFCLIFTDFLCWAPTVFFGFTAAAHESLISISVAKIFLVVFYPLNAFANPWLYVFLTKRFRQNVSRFVRKHVWLQEFLFNAFRRLHPNHRSSGVERVNSTDSNSNNYFYQNRPDHNNQDEENETTQMTSLTSRRRSSPSTCSSMMITPRGSRTSINTRSITPADLTPRSGSSDSGNEIRFFCSDSSVASSLAPNHHPSTVVNGGNPGGGGGGGKTEIAIVTRRKSTTRFRPQMSDIIETSNSNSTEDDQQQKYSFTLHDTGEVLECLPEMAALIDQRGKEESEEDESNFIELDTFAERKDSQECHQTDSSSTFSLESGYFTTTTPLILPPESRNLIDDHKSSECQKRLGGSLLIS